MHFDWGRSHRSHRRWWLFLPRSLLRWLGQDAPSDCSRSDMPRSFLPHTSWLADAHRKRIFGIWSYVQDPIRVFCGREERDGLFNNASTLERRSSEMCFILTQFLDCVHQIAEQHPCAFEFSAEYLVAINERTYSGYVGAFMHDSEKQREVSGVDIRSSAVWGPRIVLASCRISPKSILRLWWCPGYLPRAHIISFCGHVPSPKSDDPSCAQL